MEYKKFHNIEEIKKYYLPEINAYMFEENGAYLNVAFLFDLEVDSNIFASNILAKDITCLELTTIHLDVFNIKATKLFADNIKAITANVTDRIVYSGEIYIYDSINCGKLLYNKLSNW